MSTTSILINLVLAIAAFQAANSQTSTLARALGLAYLIARGALLAVAGITTGAWLPMMGFTMLAGAGWAWWQGR